MISEKMVSEESSGSCISSVIKIFCGCLHFSLVYEALLFVSRRLGESKCVGKFIQGILLFEQKTGK